MTWKMQTGKRVLNPAEAALIRTVLGSMKTELLDEERGDDQWPYGVRVFDDMTLPQRVLSLCDVCEALLDPVIPAPELTAANEGTIASIFNAMKQVLGYELDGMWAGDGDEPGPFEFDLRKLICAALQSPAGDDKSHGVDPAKIPNFESYKSKDWKWVVESLRDRILWDEDYDDDDIYADKSPEMAEFLKHTGDIPDGYFSTVVPEPREKEMVAVWKRLELLALHR